MKLVGILSWYDEKPSDLIECVGSMVKAGIDHLVAVDGAYALYPNGTPSSPRDQHDAILAICRSLDIGCTLHIPAEVFFGNEIEKRTLCFQLAEQITTEEDWYWIMDADQTVTSAIGIREALQNTGLNVARVMFHEAGTDPISGFPVRDIFRALRGLHLKDSHCNYMLPDGRRLWHPDVQVPQEEALDAWFVKIEHNPRGRTRDRQSAKDTYYDRRTRLGAETINA